MKPIAVPSLAPSQAVLLSAVSAGQKGSNADGLVPTPDEQVEQDQCGWSWWDDEILLAPGKTVLSSPNTQYQASLSALVSSSGQLDDLYLVYLSILGASLGLP